MRYAAGSGWGLTVSERSPERLKAAMKRIVTDMSLRQSLSDAARAAAIAHDARGIRAAFRDILRRSARG
jgi:hypothetical protein